MPPKDSSVFFFVRILQIIESITMTAKILKS
jgi:hypothetical protein